MNAVVTTERQPRSVLIDMAHRFGMEPAKFEATLRATCIKPDRNGKAPSAEEFAAFLLVAKEYKLNPLTKEIYAFPAKGGGIVPIVSLDGWVNLVNTHPAMDGMKFSEATDEGGNLISITCQIFRKDRSHPIEVTEWLSECIRQTEPWQMKHRMLRHKALIQCARYAFGFSGIYDEDEGAKIAEMRDITPPATARPQPVNPNAAADLAKVESFSREMADRAAPEIYEKVRSAILSEDAVTEPITVVTADGEVVEAVQEPDDYMLDANDFLDQIKTALAAEKTVEGIEDRWEDFAVKDTFGDDDEHMGIAEGIKREHLMRVAKGK